MIRNCSIHHIDKKPDGSPAVLTLASQELPLTETLESLLTYLNDSYNAKQGKSWGYFHQASGAYPVSGWLSEYLTGAGFLIFSRPAAEHLARLLDESPIATGGHVLFAHYQQGMTDYLLIALLQHATGAAIPESLEPAPARYLDLGQLHMAARINLSEWRNNPESKQYVSLLAPAARRVRSTWADFLGFAQGVDAPSETRTLLKAFSDFVEGADLAEDQAREKTTELTAYAMNQARIGAPISLEELSALLDEEQPRAFFDHIRNSDYGMAPEFPADKRTLNQFRRFTGRTEGLSISFEAHLLGSGVEFDEDAGTLTIRNVPNQLRQQLKGAKS